MNAAKVVFRLDPSGVMYLIIITDMLIKEYAGLLRQRPTEKFFNMVHSLVMDYAVEGKAPPAAVAGAVLNLVDDMMAGRDVSIRAGDYIALMNYAKAQKML